MFEIEKMYGEGELSACIKWKTDVNPCRVYAEMSEVNDDEKAAEKPRKAIDST